MGYIGNRHYLLSWLVQQHDENPANIGVDKGVRRLAAALDKAYPGVLMI